MKRLGKRSRGSGCAATLYRAVAFGLATLFSVAGAQAQAQTQTSADSAVKEDDSRRVYVFLNEGSDNAAWKRWNNEALALEKKKKRKEGVLKRYIAEEETKIAEERKAVKAERKNGRKRRGVAIGGNRSKKTVETLTSERKPDSRSRSRRNWSATSCRGLKSIGKR